MHESFGLGVASSQVLAADGTRVAWHAHGAGESLRDKPAVLLTNGLSTTPNFWKHVVRALADDHRVVHWDYRGHGESERARSGSYTIATHADDLRRVTEAVRAAGTDAGAPVQIAFSMGVTVLLEMLRRTPTNARALVLIAGGADHPYASSRLLRLPGAKAALHGGLRAAAPVVPKIGPIAKRVARSKALFPLSQRLGAIGRDAPRDEVEHFFRTVGAMDLRAYWESLRSLMKARASDILARIEVPALVIAPERDVMATRADLEALRAAIPGAEWMLVPGTGHAMLLEAGELVARRIRDFVHASRR